MLETYEQLWEREIDSDLEEILFSDLANNPFAKVVTDN